MQQKLTDWWDSTGAQRGRHFDGRGHSIEDHIIFGPSTFSMLPPELKVEVEATMRPILERFCACKLQRAALIHGLRMYHEGARLGPDGAHSGYHCFQRRHPRGLDLLLFLLGDLLLFLPPVVEWD